MIFIFDWPVLFRHFLTKQNAYKITIHNIIKRVKLHNMYTYKMQKNTRYKSIYNAAPIGSSISS